MPTAGSPKRWQAHAYALTTALLVTALQLFLAWHGPSSDPSGSLPGRAMAAVSHFLGCELGQALDGLAPDLPARLLDGAVLPLALVFSVYFGAASGLTFLSACWALPWLLSLTASSPGPPVPPAELVLKALWGVILIGLVARHARRRDAARDRAESAERQQRLRIENAGLGLVEIDLQRRCVLASARFAEMLQIPWQAVPVPLEDWLRQLSAPSAERLRTLLDELGTRGPPVFLHELELTDADGLPYWLLLSGQVRADTPERALHVQAAAIDITPRKRAEADLLGAKASLGAQLEDLRRLHELSMRLLVPGTLEAQLHQVLTTALQIHGSRHGMISVQEAGLPRRSVQIGFADVPAETLARIAAEGGICGIAMRERTRVLVSDIQRDPRCHAVRELMAARQLHAAHALPLVNDRGELMGAMSVFLPEARLPNARERAAMDMCANKAAHFIERARSRAELEASELRFESVLDASAVPFAVLSPLQGTRGELEDFRLDYLNSAATRVLRRTREQVLGRPVLSIHPGFWHQRPEVLAHARRALRQGEPCEFEFTLRADPAGRGPGQTFHCIASPMGASVALWAANVSDRMHHEQLLRDADRRKDEFIATLAHELRNLLAPIRQAAHLSSANGASEEQKRWGNELIDRQVRHMALLLDDLLDISRIARGALLLRLERAELGSIVSHAVEAVRPLIDAKQHQLVVELPPQPLRFDADALRLSQVIANLLSNAAKYTDPGGVIRLRAEAAHGELCIEVSDNGIGMPPASLSEVFHMYTRLGSGDEGKPGGGLGIGLALARGLVSLHGGRISAYSAGPGCGSRFTVRIPLLHISQPAAREPVPHPRDETPPPIRARHVLIADDNEEAAQSLSALLQMHGHRVTCAYDGEQAVAAFRADAADVCLLDIGMPLQDGKEVARAIRAAPGGGRPVLIAITGWGQEADRREAIAAGFDHHLTKPVDPEQVLRLIAAAPGNDATALP